MSPVHRSMAGRVLPESDRCMWAAHVAAGFDTPLERMVVAQLGHSRMSVRALSYVLGVGTRPLQCVLEGLYAKGAVVELQHDGQPSGLYALDYANWLRALQAAKDPCLTPDVRNMLDIEGGINANPTWPPLKRYRCFNMVYHPDSGVWVRAEWRRLRRPTVRKRASHRE
jgi:hypothetical protein